MRKLGLRSSGFVLVAALLFASAPARAESEAGRAGLQVGAMFCTLLYGPLKVVMATVGTITSGLAYAVTGGNAEIAKTVFESSVYGDYVVTPDNLTGQKPLEVVGRSEEPRATAIGEGIPADTSVSVDGY
jgi:hypothetical protein